MADAGRPWRRSFALVTLVAGIFYAVFVARACLDIDGRTVFTLFDDAMISMQYARNLAAGDGLRWNAGEAPVEGFSNLLWVLGMAALHHLPVSDEYVSLLVSLGGIAILIGVLWLVARTSDVIAGDDASHAPLYAMVLAASFYPLTYWTLRGMEVGLVALFTMLLLLVVIRARPRARDGIIGATAIVGLVLTRDDGVVPAAAILAAAALGYSDAMSRRRIAIWGVVLVLAKAGHLGWRWLYYGDLFPNTYYLKLTGVPMGRRLLRGLATYGGVVTRQLAPVAIVSAFELAHRAGRQRLLLASPFAAMSAYSVLVGGDAWEHLNFVNRYLTAAVPPLCVLGGLYLDRVRAGSASVQGLLLALGCGLIAGGVWDAAEKIGLGYVPRSSYAWGALAIAAGVALIALGRRGPSKESIRDRSYQSWLPAACLFVVIVAANARPYAQWVLSNAQVLPTDRDVSAMGLVLRDTTSPGASIAVYLAGATPYFARRKAIDLLGKNDRHVARLPGSGETPGHDKIDLPYSFGLRPDVVVTLSEPETTVRRLLEQFGYQEVCGSAWVRHDSAAVDRPALARRCVR